jgi:hypothetical protein
MQRLGDKTLHKPAELQPATGVEIAVVDIDREPSSVARHRKHADSRVLAHESETEVGHEFKPADGQTVMCHAWLQFW